MDADPTGGRGGCVGGAGVPLWQGVAVFVIGRPSDDDLSERLRAVAGAPLTYGHEGATADGASGLPDGYAHAAARRVVGHGDTAFAAAREAVRTWQLHRRQGFRVVPASPPIARGTEVLVAMRLAGPVHVLAACRVVWAVDEPRRFGFAYGTLDLHPASGEEAFVVEHDPSGEVVGQVVAFSRPHHPLVRLGGPVARRRQATATEGYLDALAAHVRDAAR
jgi:uncharacterized protein (UPF0548 family)